MAKNFLTKSRFKIGYECPTKLCYQDNKAYGNKNIDNSFLHALSEGGFQVGELAKLYYPGGTEITTLDKETAAAETAELLKQTNVIIYEAAIKVENLFVKVDLLVKKDNFIELIEVKAKSFNRNTENTFYNKTSLKKGITELVLKWEPYLVDIAYQTYVFNKAYPQFKTTSSLLLADQTAKASVDGINQKFFLDKNENGKVFVKVDPNTNMKDLGEKLLIKVPVDEAVHVVWDMQFENSKTFEQMVQHLSQICENPKFLKPTLGKQCKKCEFRISTDDIQSGLQSGFDNCWQNAANLKKDDLLKPFIFDVWNFKNSQTLIQQGVYLMEQMQQDDIKPKNNSDEAGLSNTERQWLQIEKVQANNNQPYFDHQGLAAEMASWNYPLHFIDFETTMVAIPFHKGRRPYEQIAFQFSHHLVTKDGKIIHQDEYINRTKGHFPNFDFVRALKKSLSHDEGSIFRFAIHENTVLNQIRDQLMDTDADTVPDKQELIHFIESITQSKNDSTEKWVGPRNMIDMLELVKKYFYHPATNGSNSIKKVLPAVLNESHFLQQKYSKPIYGSNEMNSLNFQNWLWIEKDALGKVIDPYKRLPPIFNDLDLDTMDSLITDDSIADGGAAMTAYARMQFTQMSESESEFVTKALLKYCELDTLAMVMIYEYWKNEIERAQRQAA